MRTIKTTLLILTIIACVTSAMAEVNFTEKTEFVASSDIGGDAATLIYYVTDNNGITLSSKQNTLTALPKELGVDYYRFYDTSCQASNISYEKNYFQIVSSDKAIKHLRLYIKNGDNNSNNLVVVGWKGAVGSSADYYKVVRFTNGETRDWVDCDLSEWNDIKTIRIYSGFNKNANLEVNGVTIYEKCNKNFNIYGIQVGFSSNTTTIGTYGFSAFSSTSALDFTNVTDCNAYYADSYAGGTLHLTKVTGVVPANFGLLLCAPEGTTTSVCIPVATAEQLADCKLTADDNVFVATSNTPYTPYTPASSTDALALGVKDSKAGFYYVGEGVAVPQNKMYLPASKVSGAKSVTLDFGGIDPTGIVNVSSDDAANIPSAQRPATDLLGRPVTNPMPGQIYIKDGKAFKLTY